MTSQLTSTTLVHSAAAVAANTQPRRSGLRLCTAAAKVSMFESNCFRCDVIPALKPFQVKPSPTPHKHERDNKPPKRHRGYNPCSASLEMGDDEAEYNLNSAFTEKTATYHHSQLHDERFKFQRLSAGEIKDFADTIVSGKNEIPLKRKQTIHWRIPIQSIETAKSCFRSNIEGLFGYLESFTSSDINFCANVASHSIIIFFNVFGVDILSRDKSMFRVLIPFAISGFLKLLYNQLHSNKLQEALLDKELEQIMKIPFQLNCKNQLWQFKFGFQCFMLFSMFRTISIFKGNFANPDSKYDYFTILALGFFLVGCLVDLLQQTIPSMVFTQKAEAEALLSLVNGLTVGDSKDRLHSNESIATLVESEYHATFTKQNLAAHHDSYNT